ncbi:hypothetical protein CK203_040023 [Vitis vinifera]|uniref:Beta-amyrin 28-oxidase n=1 Tax=Vitis vinifera TaxID=29760 RepID=A0A438IDZ4_VITVI|nr:hypothetical protein CK203_040023 [Vitis vinifera]
MDLFSFLLHPILLSVSLCVVFLVRRYKSATAKLPPGNQGWPIIGETLAFALGSKSGNPTRFIKERMMKYSPMCSGPPWWARRSLSSVARREQVSILKPQQARCHLEAAVHGEDTALRVSPKGRTKRIAQLCPGISKARCATALYTNHGFHGTGAHRDGLGS